MAICSKCGGQIDDNVSVCPLCGAPQASNTFVNPMPADATGSDYTAQFDPNDIQQNKLMAVLAYIGILFLIPLLAAPNSKYARFHANQGLVLFIVDIAVGIVSTILMFIPIVGAIIGGLLGLAIFIFLIMGIVNAASGKAKELPLIGKIRILK